MNKLLIVVVLLALSQVATAAPLLFKATKEITADTQMELATFDASKYRQIRIGFKVERSGPDCSTIKRKSESMDRELKSAEKRFEDARKMRDQGNISESSFSLAESLWKDAQSDHKAAREFPCSLVRIYGGEGDDLMPFTMSGSFLVIDQPPPKIVIHGLGEGKYSVFIWGQ